MHPTNPPDEPAVESFEHALDGDVLYPGDDGYEEARSVWNGMVDKYPSYIARCTSTADVTAAVDFARTHALPLAVKAGGHNVSGKAVCDDGLVVDLSPMADVEVDPETKTARVEPGARWADFDAAAQAHGLATTGGVDSRTGVAGLTLGGGIGWLARTHGLACDNLVAAEVVTADGEVVRADETENPELLWGLRGGGGNFGVATALEFQLHEVGPEVLTAQGFYPYADAAEALAFYREYTADAPDEVACYAMVLHVPPEPPFPEAYHLEPTVALVACHSGDVETAEAALEPIAEFGDPIFDVVAPMPYVEFQQSFDEGTPNGERYYYKSQYLGDLSDDAIETIVEYAEPLPGAFTIIGLEPMGGAINDVDATATAYPHRDAAYSFGIWAGWSDPGDDNEIIAWTREFHDAMTRYSTGGVYANYLDRDDDDQVEAAYRENYERLADLKATWDPENLFSMNQNVEPTDGDR